MIEMRLALPEEENSQKTLWKLAFGDDDDYIDYFFQQKERVGAEMLVLLENGVLFSMVALFPVTLTLPEGETVSSSYIYALATHPEAQGRGYCHHLLAYVDAYLKGKGIASVTIVPAEASLHRFFGTNGFRECFGTRKVELLRYMAKDVDPQASLSPVTHQDYNQLREQRLADSFHVSYSDEMIAYQAGLCRMADSQLYQITIGAEQGCVAAEYLNEDTLLVKELLMAPHLLEQAASLVMKTLPAIRYHLRTPATWDGIPGGYLQGFAMMKWYRPELETAWHRERKAYMGLGFD